MEITLEALGWDEEFRRRWEALGDPSLRPGRVAQKAHGLYLVHDGERAEWLPPSGALRRAGRDPLERPAVGDWVAIRRDRRGAVVAHVLERRTRFVRRAAGGAAVGQVVAANIDVVFVVTSANEELNPRRLERYLAALAKSGAEVVIVLNKIDLVGDPAPLVARIAEIAPGVAIVPTSALTGAGLDALRHRLGPGRTAAFVGSSGVGKSSLVNRLLGRDALAVGAIRASDARGRHTTTRGELVVSPHGVLLDTPGMREIQLWAEDAALFGAFPDVEAIAARCRFRDCRHLTEPDCAVRQAVERGELAADRLASYQKLLEELEEPPPGAAASRRRPRR